MPSVTPLEKAYLAEARLHARKRRRVLWTMTIVGFLAPTGIFGKFFRDNGFNTNSMKRAAKETVSTLPAAAILADASLTGFTFLTWAKWDSHTHRVPGGWLVFPATYLVGICFGAPLYLLLREYSIDEPTTTRRPGNMRAHNLL